MLGQLNMLLVRSFSIVVDDSLPFKFDSWTTNFGEDFFFAAEEFGFFGGEGDLVLVVIIGIVIIIVKIKIVFGVVDGAV